MENHRSGSEKIWMDEASIKKELKGVQNSKSSASLANSFLADSYRAQYSFPKNLEFDSEGKCDFPFLSSSRYLGLIHADGNGLGEALIKIKNRFQDGAEYAVMLRLFSDNLEKATEEAAQKATERLIERYQKESGALPMRPLVLGGDDLTVLVRADYAMQFTEDYCKAFEETTEKYFKELHTVSDRKIPVKLTACAGIAYIKNNQPFIDAFQLAESLCSASKKIAKDVKVKENRTFIPATVTSLVVTNSFIESYDLYKKKELTIKQKEKTYVATLGAYAFDEQEASIPTLKSLRNLCQELQKEGVTASSVRKYATMIFGEDHIAREKWRRWMELLGKDGKLDGLSNVLQLFGVKDVKESPWTEDNKTPIFDALQLMSMDNSMKECREEKND